VKVKTTNSLVNQQNYKTLHQGIIIKQ